jgi:uncharacterized membrane protein
MTILSDLAQISLYLIYILLPIFALYIIYLVLTRAFKDMGFSSIEAIIIVFVSFLFGLVEISILGFNISNFYLLTHNNWMLYINTGGAVIPIILSIYLSIKKRINWKKIGIGILIVTVITFFVTTPVPDKGIISPFPLWLLPAIFASLISVFLCWRDFRKAAPLAYISGTIGVLIGADFLHLWELLNFSSISSRNAVIGGANVFDMVFITGILAVIVDGIIMFKQKSKVQSN